MELLYANVCVMSLNHQSTADWFVSISLSLPTTMFDCWVLWTSKLNWWLSGYENIMTVFRRALHVWPNELIVSAAALCNKLIVLIIMLYRRFCNNLLLKKSVNIKSAIAIMINTIRNFELPLAPTSVFN